MSRLNLPSLLVFLVILKGRYFESLNFHYLLFKVKNVRFSQRYVYTCNLFWLHSKSRRSDYCLNFLIIEFSVSHSYMRVCYYTNWAQYRPNNGKYVPENLDPYLCSHLIFAFAKMNGNRLVAFEWNDESTDWMRGM